MASDSALMIQWGMPMQGREGRAMEEFFSHMQWWTELKSKGTISDFRVYGYNTGDTRLRSGFVLVEGTLDQVQKLRASDDFRSHINRVFLCVDGVSIDVLEHGDAMTKRMLAYGGAIKEAKL
jgi:hypothetical protein